MTGSIHPAIAFGRTKVGRWSYCTAADHRFGQYDNCADCSGFVSRCLWQGGMSPGEFPQSSGDMASWFANRHPERRLDIQSAKRTFGAVLTYGGFVNGPRGHVVFSLGDGLHTLESSGSRGVNIGNINRLNWSHAGLAPVTYSAPTPTPPKPPPPMPVTEDNMQVVLYKGVPNSFWIDEQGWLMHSWGRGTRENMNRYPSAPGEKYNGAFPVSVVVNGDWIHCRVVCNDLPRPNGRRLMCWDYHPGQSPPWQAYVVLPT